jgi:hypothetical protein
MRETPRLIVSGMAAAEAERLRTLVRREGLGAEVICDPRDCSQAPACRWLDRPGTASSAELMCALVETIETLERTRHAFKSKQLGQLRGRLEKLVREWTGD